MSTHPSLETQMSAYADWNGKNKLTIMTRKAATGLFDPGHHSEIWWHLVIRQTVNTVVDHKAHTGPRVT